jgi:hypothetical protein
MYSLRPTKIAILEFKKCPTKIAIVATEARYQLSGWSDKYGVQKLEFHFSQSFFAMDTANSSLSEGHFRHFTKALVSVLSPSIAIFTGRREYYFTAQESYRGRLIF